MYTQPLTRLHEKQRTFYNAAMLSLTALAVFMLLVEPAIAGNSPMGDTMCIIVNFFSGNLGRGLSTMGIIIIGIGALLGKVTWGLAIIVAMGVAGIHNATAIGSALGATGSC